MIRAKSFPLRSNREPQYIRDPQTDGETTTRAVNAYNSKL